MLLCMTAPAFAANNEAVTVLFTHDLHSHLLPATDESGASYGGYARLKTVIDEQKTLHPDALVVDAGDFSMGTLFQTIFSTDAAELRMMGALGYDVTTFGNHEYDYRADGLAEMLNAAVKSGETLPKIVQANYRPPKEGEEGYDKSSEAVKEALYNYGVEDYTVIERGGINYAVFGIIGIDSDECAPMSGMILEDMTETAKKVVEEIEKNVPEPRLVVCLSHSGTNPDPKKSEDELLANAVDGIDIIVSGHTHSTLEKPIKVNETYIVSAGEYSKNLGAITLKKDGDGYVLESYELIKIDGSVKEDAVVNEKIAEFKKLVAKNYLSRFGDMTFDDVLAKNTVDFESISELNEHKEAKLGNLISDAYEWAVENAEGENGAPVDFALTANGVIRESFAKGDITTENVFNALSLGIGADKVAGYPLVSVWITGEDLKNAFEVDASVTAIMPAAQLYFNGMTFTYNPNRMIFNKVTDCAQILDDGSIAKIEDDKLYRVVTGLYCAQMLGTVNEKSFGILSITPRDAEGNVITDVEKHIVHDSQGNEIKEWYALASYLAMLENVPEKYDAPMGRKIENKSLNPIDLVKGANWITLTVIAVIAVIIAVIVLIICLSIKKRKRKKAAKNS